MRKIDDPKYGQYFYLALVAAPYWRETFGDGYADMHLANTYPALDSICVDDLASVEDCMQTLRLYYSIHRSGEDEHILIDRVLLRLLQLTLPEHADELADLHDEMAAWYA